MTSDEAKGRAEGLGLQVLSVLPAPEIPSYAGIDHVVTVQSRRLRDGLVDELDTIQRMALLGPLTRTEPHHDGYVWQATAENVRYLSSRMFVVEGEVGYQRAWS